MKRTLTINLSGTVFHIDEDAYDKLNRYLKNVNNHFGNDADAKEIVEDIEARISDLFTEALKKGGDVITIDHVENVIAIMGTPESFLDEEPKQESSSFDSSIFLSAKKLYRDPEDGMIAGVCSGLAAYFNVEVMPVRLFFVLLLLFTGSGLLIYLILWIITPKAITASQRLQMRGEPINIDNISKTVRDEVHDVKENIKNFKSKPSYTQSVDNLNHVGSALGDAFRALLKAVGVLIGVFFLIVGVITLFALFVSMFASVHLFSMVPLSQLLDYADLYVAQTSAVNWLLLSIILVIGVPFAMLVYLGIKLIFGIRTSGYVIGSVSSALFIFGLLILLFVGGKTANEFKADGTATQQELVTTKSDTLYLTMQEDEFKDYVDQKIHFNTFRVATLNGKGILIGSPRLNIEKADGDQFSLQVKKRSRGADFEAAQINAKKIDYKYSIKDSSIVFNPSYLLPDKSPWRNQVVDLTLKVPQGKTIFVGERVQEIISDFHVIGEAWDDEIVDSYVTLTPEGFTIAEQKSK